MNEQRKYAILFSATILVSQQLTELGDRPSPTREACIATAIGNAEMILRKIDQQ